MKTLVKLFWNFFAGKGVKRASKSLFKKRIDICRENTCGDYQNKFNIERCGDCGCFLTVKAQIDEDYIECPKNLW